MPRSKNTKQKKYEESIKKLGINFAIILFIIFSLWILIGIIIGTYLALTCLISIKYTKELFDKRKLWFGGLLCVISIVLTISLQSNSEGGIYLYGLLERWIYSFVQDNIFIVILSWFACFLYNSIVVVPNGKEIYAKCINIIRSYIYECIPSKYILKFSLLNHINPHSINSEYNSNYQSSERIDKTEHRNKVERKNKIWVLPHLGLLPDSNVRHIEQYKINELAENVKESLAEHNVFVNIISTKVGARIIRFGLEPGYFPGQNNRVKVTDVARRQKDLAIKLKNPYVRIIEKPEPGEGLIGLEVPNPMPNNVSLKSVLEDQSYINIVEKRGLPFALGEDSSGKPIVLDLTKLPHLLIAGATGSGKSVCINALILSLLMSKSPNELQLVLIDPKRVELTPFNNIPHLITPVIVDTDKVSNILDYLIGEMDERYKIMESKSVRNILSYNEQTNNILPYIVLVIDELSDLIMTHGKEVESKLVRLAQLGRAAGVHAVLATQRPAVKVVTGQLKTNIPARISFAVASQVDSRVILDQNGAEMLMGNGDLLVNNNDSTGMKRGQGVFVEDEELICIKEFWQKQMEG